MKRLIIVVGIIIGVIALFYVGMRIYTKSFSPEETLTYSEGDVKISVTYSRPFKKGRDVFGTLVPYNEVWRTGANEATIFTTNTNLMIGNKLLEAGKYSIFTIPRPDNWTVIFNKETGQWGIGPLSGKANRDPKLDVLTVDVPSIRTPDLFEQLTISFEQMGEEIEMILMWDHTLIVVPMFIAKN